LLVNCRRQLHADYFAPCRLTSSRRCRYNNNIIIGASTRCQTFAGPGMELSKSTPSTGQTASDQTASATVATSGAASFEYPELHVVFDFFADNPQKVMPPPAGDVMACAAARKENPFCDPYWESIRVMQQSQWFIEGMLLKSVDCKRTCLYKTFCNIYQLQEYIIDCVCMRVTMYLL